MIKDFELIKKQLTELSQVVNGFKSEAVQLRIVELIFGNTSEGGEGGNQSEERSVSQRRRGKKKASRVKPQKPEKEGEPEPSSKTKPSKARSSGGGATELLRQMVADKYFDTPRLIGEMIDHCQVKLAKRFKANELSPGLLKLVREKLLDRDKDEETKQFKYRKA